MQRHSDIFKQKLEAQQKAKRARSLSLIEKRAIQILKRGWIRGSDLGWELWGETTFSAMRGEGSHGHNKFCRPAGKLLNRLKALGYAREKPSTNCTLWTATLTAP
jgi:hypothetical protein